MLILKTIVGFVVAFLMFGCSTKDYKHTQTKLIVIKTKKIKFADIGYIRHTDSAVELEMFMAGKVVDKISINHLVCTTKGCMSKSSFNDEYLHSSYPNDTMQNIILARPIYGGAGLSKTKDGFLQHIRNKNVDIRYKVSLHVIQFKDKKNHIIIKIKDIDG